MLLLGGGTADYFKSLRKRLLPEDCSLAACGPPPDVVVVVVVVVAGAIDVIVAVLLTVVNFSYDLVWLWLMLLS